MDLVSGKIRLNENDDLFPFEPDEWSLDVSKAFAFHKPSRLLFHISYDKDPPGLFDVFARAVHVCSSAPLPDQDSLQSLGRQAIAAFLCHIGVLEAVDDDDIPF